MPMLTKDMIKQQQTSRNAARFSTPSTPCSHMTSRVPSLSSSPSSTSSSRSRSSTPSPQDRIQSDKCWIPTLEEVSCAEPDERARLFARLVREAGHDAFLTPQRPAYTPAWSIKPPGYSSVEIGAGAFEPLFLPKKSEYPIGQPSGQPSMVAPQWDNPDHSAIEIDVQRLFSEWIVIPESPENISFSHEMWRSFGSD